MNRKNISLLLGMVLLIMLFTITGCSTKDADIKRVYIAGPFFNQEEVKNVKYAEKVLKDKGLTYYSPMRHGVEEKQGTKEWADAIFEMDRGEILKSDAVVALYYGNNSDSGTAWECGYAYGNDVPVILVHVKKDGTSNLMLHSSAYTNIYLDELKDYDFDKKPVHEYKGRMY